MADEIPSDGPQDAAGRNGRDSAGRYLPGNPGGPGRPKRHTELRYLQALRRGVNRRDWLAIVGRAVQDAVAGDDAARRWLAKYVLPVPGQLPAPSPDAGLQKVVTLLQQELRKRCGLVTIIGEQGHVIALPDNRRDGRQSAPGEDAEEPEAGETDDDAEGDDNLE